MSMRSSLCSFFGLMRTTYSVFSWKLRSLFAQCLSQCCACGVVGPTKNYRERVSNYNVNTFSGKKVISRCNCATSMWDLSKFVATREFNFKIHHDSEWKTAYVRRPLVSASARREKISRIHHLKWQHQNASARIPMHLQGGYLKIKRRILVDMHFRFPLFLIERALACSFLA